MDVIEKQAQFSVKQALPLDFGYDWRDHQIITVTRTVVRKNCRSEVESNQGTLSEQVSPDRKPHASQPPTGGRGVCVRVHNRYLPLLSLLARTGYLDKKCATIV